VSAESSTEILRVTVADSGQGFSKSRGTGVGLANIRGRLAAVHGAAAGLTLVANAPHGIRATIACPRRRHHCARLSRRPLIRHGRRDDNSGTDPVPCVM